MLCNNSDAANEKFYPFTAVYFQCRLGLSTQGWWRCSNRPGWKSQKFSLNTTYLEICTILVSPILRFSAVVEGKSYTLII